VKKGLDERGLLECGSWAGPDLSWATAGSGGSSSVLPRRAMPAVGQSADLSAEL